MVLTVQIILWHEWSLVDLKRIFSTPFYNNASSGLFLNRRDLKKITKVFNVFVDSKMIQEIEMFKVARYIKINGTKILAEKCAEASVLQAKILYDSCPAYLQRINLMYEHILQISKTTYEGVLLCTCVRGVQKFWSPVTEFQKTIWVLCAVLERPGNYSGVSKIKKSVDFD